MGNPFIPLSKAAIKADMSKEADKKHEEYSARWGDYMWIQRQAETLQKSEAEMAKMMGLEEAYMMFREKVAAEAQQSQQESMAA